MPAKFFFLKTRLKCLQNKWVHKYNYYEQIFSNKDYTFRLTKSDDICDTIADHKKGGGVCNESNHFMKEGGISIFQILLAQIFNWKPAQ